MYGNLFPSMLRILSFVMRNVFIQSIDFNTDMRGIFQRKQN